MISSSRRTAAAVVLTSALLTVCVLSTGVAAAMPTPSTSSTPMWAYGVVKTVDFHGSGGNYTYQGNATIGLSVIFNETANSSTGVVTVHAVRTVGAILNVEYCVPSCRGAGFEASFAHHAWETTSAWANLTTQGSVEGPHGSVPALALNNSSVTVTGGLRDLNEYTLGATLLLEHLLNVSVAGHVSVELTPSLGLFPLNLTPGATWNSSSGFNGSGNVNWSSYYLTAGTRALFPGNISSDGNFSAVRSGTIDLNGSYPVGSNVSFGGSSFPAVIVAVGHGFALGDGVFLLPAGADLFGTTNQSWVSNQSASAVVTAEQLDVHPGGAFDGHLPIVASGSIWESSTSYSYVSALPDGSGPLPAVPAPAASGNSTFVQAQPESVAAAQSDDHCLLTGAGCSSPLGPKLPLRLLFLGGAVVVVGAVLAIALVTRRRPPAPVYPNSALYPPGAVAAARPAPAPKPAPTEDDPLGHLW